MRNSPGNVYDNLHEPQNYCLKCWREFTTLTDEERETLKLGKEFLRRLSKNKKFRYYYEE